MIKLGKDYLKAAAAVERQALESPDLGIPVDPDVAEFKITLAPNQPGQGGAAA